MEVPRTRYAVANGVHIAWQTFGSGPVEVVFVPGWFSNVELIWDSPWQKNFFRRLSAFSRVLVSQTVKDLVAGSEIEFAQRGEYELRGVPDSWRLYVAVS